MPEFGTPFSGLANDRKLTLPELVRAIRFSISAEYEAIQLYTQLAESTEDELSAKVLKDVADEERVHVGEFLRLLRHLAPDEDRFYLEGAREVEELMGTGGTTPGGEGGRPDDTGGGGGLPYCTLAADPEHARASRDDEPCDDSRAGKV
jgi:hypothetical protein